MTRRGSHQADGAGVIVLGFVLAALVVGGSLLAMVIDWVTP